MSFSSGEIISYIAMCAEEQASLQRGMNFRLHPTHSVLLMSVRQGAPYRDEVAEDGKTLIYEGHNVPRSHEVPEPDLVDQELETSAGGLTQNGRFFQAAHSYRNEEQQPERVRVYDKVQTGIWVYSGLFQLVDAWAAVSGARTVYKFQLVLVDEGQSHVNPAGTSPSPGRVIPSAVKREVWERDGGRCVQRGAEQNLHFDHIIPYSKGGSSLTKENVQILCAQHNLEKGAEIT